MKTGIKCYDAMTKRPVIVGPEKTLRECAEIMMLEDVNSLVINEGNKVLGIVTDEDFVRKAIHENLNLEDTKIKDIMIKKVVTIDPKEDVYDAMRIMGDNSIRQLPVAVNNKLIGLITSKDLFKINPTLFDLYIEKIGIKEEKDKILEKLPIDGNCDSCGEFDALIERRGKLLCKKCSKTNLILMH